MKYTVIIRQPVADNIRSNLEKQLVERFGLSEQQAQRLAARRAGRLMKPTSQARAELLLRVFQSVGAQVVLEEVREESDTPSQAFQVAGGLGTGPGDDVVLASPLRNNATMLDFIPPASIFGAVAEGVTSPQGDPFRLPADFDPFSEFTKPAPGSAAPGSTAPGSTAPGSIAPGSAAMATTDDAELLPDWARRDPNVPPDRNPEVNLLSSLEARAASELKAVAVSPEGASQIVVTPVVDPVVAGAGSAAPAKPADDWADFAGSLKLPETSAPVAEAPRQTTEFLTAVTEDAPAQLGARNSLTRQIRLGTLLPVALASLLTLGLLALAIPRLQQQLVQTNAETLASTIALTVSGNSPSTLATQLDALVQQQNLGFVRVDLPSGQSVVRSRLTGGSEKVNSEIQTWLKTHPGGGVMNLNGQRYVVEQMTLSRGANGQAQLSESADSKGALLRRVTVGTPNAAATDVLRNILLLTLLATLIGLGIASLLANRAARQIVQPLSELVKVADAISLGDLTRPVKVARNDEIGDLAQALERMRLSLEAAMDRLRRRKRG